MLAHKWSRPDLLERMLGEFERSGADYLLKAAGQFREKQRDNKLCAPLDADHRVGQFTNGGYAPHRFAL
jgi:hypothetical protein